MSNQKFISAQTALNNQRKSDKGHVIGSKVTFTCPYSDCGTFALQYYGNLSRVDVSLGESTSTTRLLGKMPPVNVSKCEACGREAIYIGGQLSLPADSDAPPPAADLPQDCKLDYEEARAIQAKSPRGAAALLRLTIQKLLPYLGAKKPDINAAIGELVASGKIKTQIQKALDTVRVIGNESVHPGEMDLRDDRDTALALFRIVNLIVETEITEPKRLEALYASLPPRKLDGIKQRDALKP